MAIIRRVRWEQPLGPVRIADAWRSRVMSAWYPRAGVDVVRGDIFTINGSTTLQYVTGGKFKAGSQGTSTSVDYASLGILKSPGDATRISSLTIATVATNFASRAALFDVSSNGTSLRAGEGSYAVATGYATASMIFSYNDEKFTGNAFAGTFVANERHVFGSSYSETSPTNTVSYYKDGGLVGTASYDTAIDVRYGTYPYVIGGRKASTGLHGDAWGGWIELQVLFPPVLTAAEFWALSQNPWQLFEPVRRTIFFIGAAAGTTDATIAAVESADAAAVTAISCFASVAATETEDTATLTAISAHAAIAATETADSAAIAVTSASGSIAATETEDSAIVTATSALASIAATETEDVAAITAISAFATVAATETEDTATLMAISASGTVAAVETEDVANITGDANLGVTSASIGATETADATAVATEVTTGATVAATETADTATVTGISCFASIAGVETLDVAAVTAVMQLDSFIVATESSDAGAITVQAGNATLASIAAEDAQDAVFILTAQPIGTAPGSTKSLRQTTPRIGITPAVEDAARLGLTPANAGTDRLG